jgi:hypothetical protein
MLPSTVARYYMIQSKLSGLPPAILTGIMVSVEHFNLGQLFLVARRSNHIKQADDGRYLEHLIG